MLRADRPRPAGAGSTMRRTAPNTARGFASGSPIPMKTTLLRRVGPPARSPSRAAAAARRTCSTISAVDRLRVSPCCPVAQNGQAMPQPACEDTHSVVRPG
jgi:hypothetical protein